MQHAAVALEKGLSLIIQAYSAAIFTGNPQYLINEDYILGDADTDKTSQNELFETLDNTVLDFSETNPFGDVGSL